MNKQELNKGISLMHKELVQLELQISNALKNEIVKAYIELVDTLKVLKVDIKDAYVEMHGKDSNWSEVHTEGSYTLKASNVITKRFNSKLFRNEQPATFKKYIIETPLTKVLFKKLKGYKKSKKEDK